MVLNACRGPSEEKTPLIQLLIITIPVSLSLFVVSGLRFREVGYCVYLVYILYSLYLSLGLCWAGLK